MLWWNFPASNVPIAASCTPPAERLEFVTQLASDHLHSHLSPHDCLEPALRILNGNDQPRILARNNPASGLSRALILTGIHQHGSHRPHVMPRSLHRCRDVQLDSDPTLGIHIAAPNCSPWKLIEVRGLAGMELIDADVVWESVDDG